MHRKPVLCAAALVMLLLVVDGVQGAPRLDLDLATIRPELVSQYGAKCLDGSVPAYYRRLGSEPNKWRIHFRGGAWCFDPESCYERSLTALGSSTVLGNDTADTPFGFMAQNESHFGNWTLVLVEYCDGSSWTSNREDPVAVNNTNIWFRGRRNLLATLQELEAWSGLLSRSTDIVFTGTSAGGMHTYLNGDTMASFVTSQARVVLLPDAGFFIFDGYPTLPELKNGYTLWNATDALYPECLSSVAEAYECLIPKNALPHVRSDVFALQSLYDTAQNSCDTNSPGCNASIVELRGYLQGNLTATATARTGIFATACRQHQESCQDFDWDVITVAGVKMETAFYNFYYNNDLTARFDVDWPNNPTCIMSGAFHGDC
ncbi:Pectin acetylesterase 7 [Diplonema papillatum]|nr:Pectin acetylesterase 7 [Diplonema papillatum]